MAIPSSGPISMSQFRAEWGAPTPTPLSWFRGKPNLPAGPTIRFSDFYGKSNIVVNMPDVDLSAIELGGSAQCQLNLLASGSFSSSQGAPGPSGQYVTPASGAALLEVFASVLTIPSAGAVWGGAPFEQWLPLTATRSWSLTLSTPGFDTGAFSLQFRAVGQTPILDSADILMHVQQGSPP